ncbi:sensor histidine kinase [Bacillus sp. Marseille-P3661]|uniref:sensor histidine kinase n=1 Tax=Bacillus sp. Marseille-P3661 TaxID=1936234 RepID=UPI000C84B6C7|nr:ATP-binding protein [Bacillus sp. Marseille-P3661]
MKRLGIVAKIGGTIAILILTIILPLGIVIDQVFSNFFYGKMYERIDDLSAKYARSIDDIYDPTFSSFFNAIAELTDTEILIISSDRKIISSSGFSEFTQGQALPESHPFMNDLRVDEPGQYKDRVTDNHYLYSGKQIKNDNVVHGVILVFTSLEDIYQSIALFRQSLMLSVTGAIIIALGFTYIVSNRLSRPLLEMEKATRNLAKGKLHTRVVSQSKDEIGLLADAINDLAVELYDYRENRKEFLASISHELRTPMTYIKGYAQVIRNQLYETEDEKERYLLTIEQESEKMSRLIEDLFELSKMELNKLDIQVEWIDVIEVMERAIWKTKQKVSEKNLKLKFNFEPNVALLHVDGFRLEQIFINLIENAIRYTNQGQIDINIWQSKKSVKITVQDTGKGIPEKDLPFIFDRFYRVEKSRSKEYGGTGLGLAIVKNLTSLMHGQIEVKSELSKGSCFTFTFPVKMEENN